MKKYKTDPYFINGQHRITITVVGAGGTGSLIVTKLARLSKALNHLEHPGLYVNLIDFDIVENHNVGRQMFTENDVGRYKSDVLIEKINNAFGFDWERSIKPFREDMKSTNIIISAVDNVLTRKEILNFFYKEEDHWVSDIRKKYLLIDSGNARDYGQVILSDVDKKLKNVFDFFPDAEDQDNEKQQGLGCSYAESLLEQDLFINDYASLYAVTIIKDLLFKKEIDYQGFFFNTKEHLTQKIKI